MSAGVVPSNSQSAGAHGERIKLSDSSPSSPTVEKWKLSCYTQFLAFFLQIEVP